MSYITRDMSVSALKHMEEFHKDILHLCQTHQIDLLGNLGRRNVILSQAQEKFFGQELDKVFDDVVADGRTGEPDIFIGDLDKEVECKLTSRNSNGSIAFQTDRDTLTQKKSLDYLYVIADETFQSFAVLHFEDLTIEDFRPISPGARGKVAMYKHKGMKKCNMIIGEAINKNEAEITKIEGLIKNAIEKFIVRMRKIYDKIDSSTVGTVKFDKLNQLRHREAVRYQKRIDKLYDRLRYWKNTDDKFSFNLEAL